MWDQFNTLIYAGSFLAIVNESENLQFLLTTEWCKNTHFAQGGLAKVCIEISQNFTGNFYQIAL